MRGQKPPPNGLVIWKGLSKQGKERPGRFVGKCLGWIQRLQFRTGFILSRTSCKIRFSIPINNNKKRTICERQCSTCFIKYYMFLTFPLQILHTLGKITENEIWQDEKENMVNIFSMIWTFWSLWIFAKDVWNIFFFINCRLWKLNRLRVHFLREICHLSVVF